MNSQLLYQRTVFNQTKEEKKTKLSSKSNQSKKKRLKPLVDSSPVLYQLLLPYALGKEITSVNPSGVFFSAEIEDSVVITLQQYKGRLLLFYGSI